MISGGQPTAMKHFLFVVLFSCPLVCTFLIRRLVILAFVLYLIFFVSANKGSHQCLTSLKSWWRAKSALTFP